jgi:hypothetical protein
MMVLAGPVVQEVLPEPSVVRTLPAVPPDTGSVNVQLADVELDDLIEAVNALVLARTIEP